MRIGYRRVSRDHDWHTTAPATRCRAHCSDRGTAPARRPAPTDSGSAFQISPPTMCDGTLLLLGSTTAHTHRRYKASRGVARPRWLTLGRGPTRESRLSASLDTPKWRHFPAAPAVP